MKNDRYDRMLLLFLAAGLLLCGILAVFFPAPRFSEKENRLLADKPRFSLAALADGSWETSVDNYVTERFFLREECRALHAVAELAQGKREVDGILLADDGSLLRKGSVSSRVFAANLHGLNRLSQQAKDASLPCVIAAVPRAADVRTDVLPSFFCPETEIYETLCQSVPGAVALTELNEGGDFYATDHHLTTAGAYRAYLALCPLLGISPHPREDFGVETVSTSFFGTSDAAAGIPLVKPDRVELYRFEGDENFRLTRDGTPAAFLGFYDREKLNHRDRYAVFLGGNAGTTEVTEGEDDTRPLLLLIKDSYGNALIPFLARHFRIFAVDPRYTATPPAAFLEKADAVLAFCGMQTLTETSMFK